MTLDSGPLVLLDRGNQTMLGWLEVARRTERSLRTSAVTVAEVWRGGPRAPRLSRALAGIEVVDVDLALAKRAGVLLAGVPPVKRRLLAADALVVACAATNGDLVLTTDPADVEPLAAAAGVRVVEP